MIENIKPKFPDLISYKIIGRLSNCLFLLRFSRFNDDWLGWSFIASSEQILRQVQLVLLLHCQLLLLLHKLDC